MSISSDTCKQDWQAYKTTVRERNAAMCNNELMADVTFVVNVNVNMNGEGAGVGGPTVKFPAHKYVLATGSSVFFAMFYGPLAESGEEVHVPDVEPEAFLKMLK